MRLSLLILMPFILISCAKTPQTRIAYGVFSTFIPSEEFDDALILSFQEIAFKTKDGKIFGGRPVSNESEEGLPNDFNITQFPKYALMLNQVPEDTDYSKHMMQVTSETDYLYDASKNAVVFNKNNLTIYSSCKDRSCIAYAVKDGINDYILEITGENISKEEFEALLHNGIK